MKKKVLLFILALFLFLMPVYATDIIDFRIAGTFDYAKAQEVLTIVNEERAQEGLGKLEMDESLMESAMERAAEISLYFSHTRPDGSGCFTVNSKVFGENIAAGRSTAAGTMESWMNSAGHRANILTSDYKSIGIGSFSVNGVYYWVQLFSYGKASTISNKNSTFEVEKDIAIQKELVTIRGNASMVSGDKMLPSEKRGYMFAAILNKGWESVSNPGTQSNWIYSTSDSSVISIDKEGKFLPLKEGKSTLKVCLKALPSECYSKTIEVYRVNIANIVDDDSAYHENVVDGFNSSYEYTGKEIKPEIRVWKKYIYKPAGYVYNLGELKENVDYKVTYKNNIYGGTAQIIITGLGDYKGTITKTFTIVGGYRNGLFYNDATKRWEYYKDGKPDYTYTGYASNANGTYYVQKGIVTFKYNALGKYNGKWVAIVNSKVNPTYTGVSKNSNGTYYLEKGNLSFKYNGNYKDKDGNIYVLKNSKVDATVNGLKQVSGTWYYFKNGKSDLTYTGYATNSNGTYYVQKGIVTLKFTALLKYNGKWTAIVGSKVNPTYTGLTSNSNGTYLLEKGNLSFKYNGNYKDKDGNIYVLKNSKVDKTFTGLKQVSGTWYYFKNGKTDLNYNGFASNSNGTYYVQKGIVTLKYNDLVMYNGKWTAIVNSKVNTSYTGLSTNKNGTYLLEKGTLTFKYNGKYTYNGKTYTIRNSKVV